MTSFSLSSKITSTFVVISVATLGFLYFAFLHLFEEHVLKVEEEKSVLIAQTIEPMLAMNFYLGLEDEARLLADQTASRENVLGLKLVVDGVEFWSKEFDHSSDYILTTTPIMDPILASQIGSIELAYAKDAFFQARTEIQQQILYYLGLLAFVFVVFGLLMRYFLNPLSQIADKVKSYVLGEKLDFSDVRVESETVAISDAFLSMVSNIREYTLLLEQYKLSVDESAIVTKIDLDGCLTYANSAFKQIANYSEHDLKGCPSFLLAHPESQSTQYEQIWQVLNNKQIWKGVLRHPSRDGECYYAKSTIVPMLDEHQNVTEYISIQHDITQIIEQQEQINRQTTDLVTGLPNRIKFEEDAKATKSPKLAILSIDNFRVIKDYYGYSTAESALKEVGSRLQNSLEIENIQVYKLGEGEYALLANQNCSVKAFETLCLTLIETLEASQVHYENDHVDLQLSAGLTANQANLLAYAALALKHAQDLGKTTVLYENEENLASQYKNNLIWTKKVKQALADDRIAVYVQPIVDAQTLEVIKYECLVRLIEEGGKVISPFFFLEVAKKTKLYHQVTQRVISIAFEVFEKIPDKEFSINLSPLDLLHDETLVFLKTKIKQTGLASRLVIEIIESEEIEDFEAVTDFISELKALGCKVAIDDFGTGYSNFSYLMQLNTDYIKVDGSLIKDIDKDMNSEIISTTIIQFAEALGIKTIAEFVHSEPVMQKTQVMGFDYLQGYHLGEPVPASDLIKALSKK